MEAAIMHYESKLLIKHFSSWKMFHNYKKEKLNIAQRISAHNRERLLKRYFGHFIMVRFKLRTIIYISLTLMQYCISSIISVIVCKGIYS